MTGVFFFFFLVHIPLRGDVKREPNKIKKLDNAQLR
jgi:hypothetical protein